MSFHSHMLRDTFAQWCFLNDLSTEDVAALLGHSNIQITQQHYAPFMIARQKRLTNRVKEALFSPSTGQSFTAISANSLSDPFLLTRLSIDVTQRNVTEQVVLFRPATNQFDVVSLASSRSSMASLSADGLQIAYGTVASP